MCPLFQRKGKYLGHIISEEGVSTDLEKTWVVQQWKPPMTVKQVGSFLGFVGYYQRFIPAFAKIAAPLHASLAGTSTVGKKDQTIEWSPQCQATFEKLKAALLSTPVLAYAEFSQPFHLYTDASLEGLGAVLSKVQDGCERVTAYASRSLHPTETNDQSYSSFK